MELPFFDTAFEEKALGLFRLHVDKNPIYRKFCQELGIAERDVDAIYRIPFMPIGFFKHHQVYIAHHQPQLCFHSSGTTGSQPSKHYIASEADYEQSLLDCFRSFYPSSRPVPHLFALLPNYQANPHSSLIYMLEALHRLGAIELRGYFNQDYSVLRDIMEISMGQGCSVIVWGVSFALLRFARQGGANLSGHMVIETGGMKGQEREIIRDELHAELQEAFHLPYIASEYGMTELMSQAYAPAQGMFQVNEHIGVLVRDLYDPLGLLPHGKTGAINIIDLNNRHSCPFIATQDLGRTHANGTFEVMGRVDNSEIRGCNLLSAS
ncbi:MAG: acyl transferase [Bacteroidetes bacterium]|jgi:phenylacetate-coenzyme A ligase PaaK-like adenylate-forming protein|nr:acyl transferase [Bacteroidota bacterium]